jgi:hypothetical protein
MTRNLLLFLAGVVVALGVLKAWPEARTALFGPSNRIPGSGSNIRVVGGSVRPKLRKDNWSVDLPNQLQVQNVDAWSYMLENVATKPGGPLVNVYYPHMSDSWTVDELVKDPQDPNRGVEVVGFAGATQATGRITFTLLNGGDKFGPSTESGGKPNDRQYYNSMSNAHCNVSPEKCEKVDRIVVKTQGVQDLWYCVHKEGKCHVDIGDDQP